MDTNHEQGKIRFPNRDGIGSTFLRRSDTGTPAIDSEPAAVQDSGVDLANATIPGDEYVTIDRGDGFVWRVRVNSDAYKVSPEESSD